MGKRDIEKKGGILMQKYELGHLLGQGTFGKVYHAHNLNTGQDVAIKVIDKEKVLRGRMIKQIKREISVMRLVKHPNIVQLHEVMASKTKIYFAMEKVKGGELFSKVEKGRLSEDLARKYFQQLIEAVDFCHSRGVYHRDVKPENLLLDEKENLKVTDFGLSALWDSKRKDGLLHTTCGTPAYVAPEVVSKKGYDGAKADIWSCGVVLFVLLAGHLPFQDTNIHELYKKIRKGEFKTPNWLSSDVKKLLPKILDPNPSTRISIANIRENSWFRKGLKHVESLLPLRPTSEYLQNISVHDVQAAFASSLESDNSSITVKGEVNPEKLHCLNAFDIISLAPGFDLSGLFEKDMMNMKPNGRFTTTDPTSTIVSKLEEAAKLENFQVKKGNGTVILQGSREGRKGQLIIDAEIFEVTPAFYVVELQKTAGDTLEYKKFYEHDLMPSLKDVVWTFQGKEPQ